MTGPSSNVMRLRLASIERKGTVHFMAPDGLKCHLKYERTLKGADGTEIDMWSVRTELNELITINVPAGNDAFIRNFLTAIIRADKFYRIKDVYENKKGDDEFIEKILAE